MTHGLSRRVMALTGGVAVALANGPGLAQKPKCPVDSVAGYDDHFGKDPHKDFDYNGAEPEKPYDPKYIAIVIIDFKRNWTVSVHHASFPLDPPATGNTPDYRLGLADKLISWVVDKKARRLGHWKDYQGVEIDHVPYKRKYGVHKDKHHIASFDSFKFLKQNEIFIFLNNNDIKIDPNNLIRFTKYSASGQLMKDPNYAFFKALPVEGLQLSPFLRSHGKMIRIQNHATYCNGKPVTDPTVYSMNVHFQMRVRRDGTTEQGYVPMVIDPDTGNGTGNEP